MATFYILPSRPEMGRRFADFLASQFPGLNYSPRQCFDLAEQLGEILQNQPEVFAVFREDLAPTGNLRKALAQDGGAEPWDAIIDVSHRTPQSSLAV